MNTATNSTVCIKCSGTGRVCFKHIENGKCFACNGSGVAVVRATGRKAPVKASDAFARVTECRNLWASFVAGNVSEDFATDYGCTVPEYIRRTLTAYAPEHLTAFEAAVAA